MEPLIYDLKYNEDQTKRVEVRVYAGCEGFPGAILITHRGITGRGHYIKWPVIAHEFIQLPGNKPTTGELVRKALEVFDAIKIAEE